MDLQAVPGHPVLDPDLVQLHILVEGLYDGPDEYRTGNGLQVDQRLEVVKVHVDQIAILVLPDLVVHDAVRGEGVGALPGGVVLLLHLVGVLRIAHDTPSLSPGVHLDPVAEAWYVPTEDLPQVLEEQCLPQVHDQLPARFPCGQVERHDTVQVTGRVVREDQAVGLGDEGGDLPPHLLLRPTHPLAHAGALCQKDIDPISRHGLHEGAGEQ